MELQVKELLDRIQSEGVEAAEKRAQAIIAAAEEQARSILAEAESQSARAWSEAKGRIEQAERSSKLALEQASRDTLLALRQKVEAFMNAAVLSSVKEALDASLISQVLTAVLKELAVPSGKELSVLLPSKTLSALDEALSARLAKDLGRGVVFKPFSGLDAGFRVSVEGSSAHLDFSAEAVAQILASRVNAKLAECLRSSLGADRTP